MKKSTYAIIGLLLLMALTSVVLAPITIGALVVKADPNKKEVIDSVLTLTGKTVFFGTEDCSGIEFDTEYYDDSIQPYINVVFDPSATKAEISMDSIWCVQGSYGPDGDIFKVENEFLMISWNEDEEEESPDDSESDSQERAPRVVYSFDSSEPFSATVVLPATPGAVTFLVAPHCELRVYGTVPAGFSLNGQYVKFYGSVADAPVAASDGAPSASSSSVQPAQN